MIFYRALQEPFMHPEYNRYCLIIQGSHDGAEMHEFEVFFEDFDEAYVVWRSFLDRFDFHTDKTIDDLITSYREKQADIKQEDN